MGIIGVCACIPSSGSLLINRVISLLSRPFFLFGSRLFSFSYLQGRLEVWYWGGTQKKKQ